jgi:ubiquitin carboxyl-terminal hydrolase 5/13
LSGKYSFPSEIQQDEHKQPIQNGIAPRMLKSIIGKGHAEFSTSRQQDALEYFQHLLTLIERDERKTNPSSDVSKILQFDVEERIECSESHAVKYTHMLNNVLSLPIPVEQASNLAEVKAYQERKKKEEEEKATTASQSTQATQTVPKEEPVRPRLTLDACFEAWASAEMVPDFYSTALQRKTVAIRQSRLGTFPDYLVVQLRKFYVGEDWSPKKLDAFVEVPDSINLEKYRGKGMQSNEQPLPEGNGQGKIIK